MDKTSESNPNLVAADSIKPARLELDAVRKQLAEAKGPRYWRTLEELSGQEAFGEMLEREFPRQHSEWLDPVSRRNFLKLAGASMALAGLAGCTRQPLEQILPYVRQPEELIPGKPIYFATAMPFSGYAQPLLVETHEYRPTKIEGNPQHACSLGSSDLFAQASILDLYDPDRSTVITYQGEPRPWGEFLGAMRTRVMYHKGNQGAGLRFLSGAVCSPTLGSQMKAIQQLFPQSKWHRWEPAHRDGARAGSKAAFGGYYDPQYKFAAADVVVSLDASFLSGSWFPGFVRYSRDFMSRRKLQGPNAEMNRLYVAESAPTTTGAKADHRLVVKHSEVDKIARALAAKIGVAGEGSAGNLSPEQQKWVDAAAADLQGHHGKGLVVPGEFHGAAVHALAHAMNAALGNVGQTVSYIDPVEIDPVENAQSIKELVDDINAGKVTTLVIFGGNQVYDAPADVNFQGALSRMLQTALDLEEAHRQGQRTGEPQPIVAQLSIYNNDTTDFCTWHVPAAHYLESWSDARSFDGTASIIQPMILPLYDGKSAHEIAAIFTDQPGTSGHDLVQAYWRSQHPGDDFEKWWRTSLHDGYVSGSAFPTRTVAAKLNLPEPHTALMLENGSGEQVEVIFRPDPCIYDGRYVNNAWLQETPKPLTRSTWDNLALISPAMAQRLEVLEINQYKGDHQSDSQRMVTIEFQGRTIKAPYWAQPGHPDHAVTLYFGYGQKKTGRVGMEEQRNVGRGYSAYSMRPVASQYAGVGGNLTLTNDYYSIAVTQGHFSMEGREPVKVADLEEYRSNPGFAHEKREEEPQDKGLNNEESLYPDFRKKDEPWYAQYAWAMAIDLNSCIGCQTCAVACQAENNIPVVGKQQVQRGREMQWIRIDAYYEGDPANPSVYFQPVPCMQCENAPCEPVCPVGATVHSTEGLNDMVYNRCVGTRYCSNNCPYKVRRFNFLLFSDYTTPSLKMMRNPDVTVRSRGVMEKCTYCVQRITAGRIAAEKEQRKIRDGEVIPACQQACPTQAIIFGDKNDPNSRVSQLRKDERNYQLLAELNTRPRTTYIAAVRNPNPALKSSEKA